MWNRTLSVVQIHIGQIIVVGSTPIEQRIEKTLSTLRSLGLPLPPVNIVFSSDRDYPRPNEVILYFGLDSRSYTFSSDVDMIDWVANLLVSKVNEYKSNEGIVNQNRLLKESYTALEQNRYQEVLKSIRMVYYHASLEGNSKEAALAVSIAGNLLLESKAHQYGTLFHLKAVDLCQNQTFDDVHLKAHLYYASAVSLTNYAFMNSSIGDFGQASTLYDGAYNLASQSNCYPLMFLSKFELANLCSMIGFYDVAISYLQECESMIFADGVVTAQEQQQLQQIRNAMAQIQSHLSQQYKNRGNAITVQNNVIQETKLTSSAESFYEQMKPLFNGVKDIVYLLIKNIIVDGISKKLGLAKGILQIIFNGSVKYDMSRSTFNGSAQIGPQNTMTFNR